jgi:multisubunit Na+/H+ antiporter MnhB subunit
VIGRRSAIVDEADRWLFPVILLVSVYVALKGHNAPGGGFAGGLVAGCAFVLRYLAGGSLRLRRSVRVAPTVLVGLGLAIAVLTSAAPLLAGDALLDSAIVKLDVPLIGQMKLVSSAVFDLGVYVVVVGVVLSVLMALGADPAGTER